MIRLFLISFTLLSEVFLFTKILIRSLHITLIMDPIYVCTFKILIRLRVSTNDLDSDDKMTRLDLLDT